MKKNGGHVYFVTDGEAIKIGFASNIRKRIRALQTSHHFPLFLLGAVEGSRGDESLMHARFGHLRLKGEWFEKSREITQVIDELEAAGRFVDSDDIDDWNRRLHIPGRNENVVTDHD